MRRETLDKQLAHNLIYSRLFYLLLTCSKTIYSSEIHSQMHDFDLPFFVLFFFKAEKEQGNTT